MDTSTVKETVDKVDAELSEMGIDGVKENLKEILNIKDYLANQLPAVVGFGLKVILAIFVFFIGRKVIRWIIKVVRKSLEKPV